MVYSAFILNSSKLSSWGLYVSEFLSETINGALSIGSGGIDPGTIGPGGIGPGGFWSGPLIITTIGI